MQTMARLRDIYAAADYSTAFLEAAIRKAEITLPQKPNEVKEPRNVITSTQGLMDAGRRMKLTNPPPPSSARGHLTPPPEQQQQQHISIPAGNPLHDTSNTANPTIAPNGIPLTDDDIARRLSTFLASTPPDSDHHGSGATDPDLHTADFSEADSLWAQQNNNGGAADANMFSDGAIMIGGGGADFEPDFESMINLDALGSGFDGEGSLQGEGGGFALDMDWMQGGDGLGGGVGEGMEGMGMMV